jgi:hypothetical protein
VAVDDQIAQARAAVEQRMHGQPRRGQHGAVDRAQQTGLDHVGAFVRGETAQQRGAGIFVRRRDLTGAHRVDDVEGPAVHGAHDAGQRRLVER